MSFDTQSDLPLRSEAVRYILVIMPKADNGILVKFGKDGISGSTAPVGTP
jgi:hypothetical protein